MAAFLMTAAACAHGPRRDVAVNRSNLDKDTSLELGMLLTDVPRNYEAVYGVFVRFVLPGSPSDRAGFRHGDIIQSINDRVIQTIADADVLLATMPSQSRCIAQVARSRETLFVPCPHFARGEVDIALVYRLADSQAPMLRVVSDMSAEARARLGFESPEMLFDLTKDTLAGAIQKLGPIGEVTSAVCVQVTAPDTSVTPGLCDVAAALHWEDVAQGDSYKVILHAVEYGTRRFFEKQPAMSLRLISTMQKRALSDGHLLSSDFQLADKRMVDSFFVRPGDVIGKEGYVVGRGEDNTCIELVTSADLKFICDESAPSPSINAR